MSTELIRTNPTTEPPTVRLVTALAETLDIPDAEYRKLYDGIREGRSLRNCALAIQSTVSYGWWDKYERGLAPLNRERKNELRRAAGLPELPPTVGEAVAEAHPDAAVYKVGDDAASRIVMVGRDVSGTLDLRINGSLSVITALSDNSHVTGVTGRKRLRTGATISVSVSLRKRMNEARLASGETWERYIERLQELAEATPGASQPG